VGVLLSGVAMEIFCPKVGCKKVVDARDETDTVRRCLSTHTVSVQMIFTDNFAAATRSLARDTVDRADFGGAGAVIPVTHARESVRRTHFLLAADAARIRSACIPACHSRLNAFIPLCMSRRRDFCNAAGAALKKQAGMPALRMLPVTPLGAARKWQARMPALRMPPAPPASGWQARNAALRMPPQRRQSHRRRVTSPEGAA
jgi:hypothetical protein